MCEAEIDRGVMAMQWYQGIMSYKAIDKHRSRWMWLSYYPDHKMNAF